ncbi:hypothetical protein [Actinokineospora terrae]|uniref:Ig-like domain (Group 3) n=1 Tax=Actinokineospora terrae TaxID=155974 RepID=A0A1H9U9C0_9PSEU|nr:hypothetical protein [Actinokineospora terrae]SES05703.1 hypothetical protein SAMN04487818_10757 [Actinokineospora terrae]
MRSVGRLASITVAAAALLVALAPLSSAAVPPPAVSLSISPTSGPAGSTFTISWSLGVMGLCRTLTFATSLTTIPTVVTNGNISGSFSVVVPRSAKPTTYSITGTCNGDGEQGITRFTVTVPTTTTTTPPTTKPTTTTVPPVTTTIPPVTTTTSRPTVTTTTTGPTTTTTTPGVTTTDTTSTTSDTTTTTEPPTTTTTPIVDEKPVDGGLKLDRKSVRPGDPLSAKGAGCTPSQTVILTSGGEQVGTAVSDSGGVFTARVEFPKIVPGRHIVTAHCGIQLTGAVDQVVTSGKGGTSGTLVVLVFFVLAGAALIRVA